MNTAFSKENIIYIAFKSFIIVALITLFDNWQQSNLIFHLSLDQITEFILMFIVCFFVQLIFEVLKENS